MDNIILLRKIAEWLETVHEFNYENGELMAYIAPKDLSEGNEILDSINTILAEHDNKVQIFLDFFSEV